MGLDLRHWKSWNRSLGTPRNESLAGHELVSDILGEGPLKGIRFTPPLKMMLRLPFEAFMAIHKGMFGQVVVMRLFVITES